LLASKLIPSTAGGAMLPHHPAWAACRLRAGRRQNRSGGAILGEEAIRATPEWREQWLGEPSGDFASPTGSEAVATGQATPRTVQFQKPASRDGLRLSFYLLRGERRLGVRSIGNRDPGGACARPKGGRDDRRLSAPAPSPLRASTARAGRESSASCWRGRRWCGWPAPRRRHPKPRAARH
jgi:hypothetical protein